jgi:hypothetical protein
MANYGDMPFGLNSVKIIGITLAGTVTLPAAQTLKFKDRVLSGELRGDDAIKAVAAISEAAEWELEAGGISLEALALMTGRTIVSAGTTPTGTITLRMNASLAYPYFKLYGKVLGVGSDDVHCKLFKCKVTDSIEGTFKGGEFFVTSIKGVAIDDSTNGIMQFVQNETAAALPTS